VPFRARSLLRRNPQWSKHSAAGGGLTTRPDTATGTPGSVGERKVSSSPAKVHAVPHLKETVSITAGFSRGHIYSLNSYRKVADVVCKSKQRVTGKHLFSSASAMVPHLVDLPFGDLTIPEKSVIKIGPVRPLRRYVRSVKSKVLYEPDEQRSETVFVLRNVNNTLTFETRPEKDWVKAFNENCKAFGPVSRNRHFRFYLKWLTFFGANKKDFGSVMRIRDLWIRGSQHYRKAMIKFNMALNNDLVEFIKDLPKKGRRVSTRG
jgi:hypothetical protein